MTEVFFEKEIFSNKKNKILLKWIGWHFFLLELSKNNTKVMSVVEL